MEHVILVDEQDNPLGTMEKMEAHRLGVLHRAFSVLLFDSEGRMLLQKRATSKYHCGGLWTNTCCSHPQPGELIEDAVKRKLAQEMGINVCTDFAFSFIYKANLENGLTEYEYDHVFIGHYNDAPSLNAEEAEAWRYISVADTQMELAAHPELFTPWFKIILDHPELKAITA